MEHIQSMIFFFFPPWQLLIYLHLGGLLQDEQKRSQATLLPSAKAVFQSIQQQVLEKKNSLKCFFTDKTTSLVVWVFSFFSPTVEVQLSFPPKKIVAIPAMEVSAKAASQMKL